jgi:hypothetical protein
MPQHGNPTGRADANSRVPRASKPPAFPEKEMRAAKNRASQNTELRKPQASSIYPAFLIIHHHRSSSIQHPAAFSIQHQHPALILSPA